MLGPIRPKVLGQVAVCLIEALSYLYDKHRILHRDVRPARIFINSNGVIKLGGFGLNSPVLDGMASTFLASSMESCMYVSPERVSCKSYGPPSDVWGMGMSLLELAQGFHPFAKLNIVQLVSRLAHGQPPSISLDMEFSDDFRKTITKCLMSNPYERSSFRQLYV